MSGKLVAVGVQPLTAEKQGGPCARCGKPAGFEVWLPPSMQQALACQACVDELVAISKEQGGEAVDFLLEMLEKELCSDCAAKVRAFIVATAELRSPEKPS